MQVTTMKVQLQDAKRSGISKEDDSDIHGPEMKQLKDQARPGLPFPDASKLLFVTGCGPCVLMRTQ